MGWLTAARNRTYVGNVVVEWLLEFPKVLRKQAGCRLSAPKGRTGQDQGVSMGPKSQKMAPGL